MSEGALQIWARGQQRIELRGLSWMEDDDMHPVPIKTLASNILCKDHNSALSPLDALGKRWMEHLRKVNADINSVTSPRPITILFVNGHDLERWMLKMLCGLLFRELSTFVE